MIAASADGSATDRIVNRYGRSYRLSFAAAVVGAALGGLGTPTLSSTLLLALGGAVAVAIAFVDISERRIPNTLTLPAIIGLLAVAVGESARSGSSAAIVRVVVGTVFGAAPLAAAYLVRPAAIGGGDVKAAGVLAGFAATRLVVAVPFLLVVACAAGLCSALVYRPWRRSLPFGLFLAVGFGVTVLAVPVIRSWIEV